jgi:PAS domain S-box-containing protein
MLSAPLKPRLPRPSIHHVLAAYLAASLGCLLLLNAWGNAGAPPLPGQVKDLLFLLLTGTALFLLGRRYHRQVLGESLQKNVLARNAAEAILTVDDAGRILEFNFQAENLFGLPRAEVLGRTLDGYPSLLRILMMDPLGTDAPKRLTSVVNRDGETFPVELTFAILAQDDRVTLTCFLNKVAAEPPATPPAAPGDPPLEEMAPSDIELTLAYETVLEGWARALDLRDKETLGHTQRVTEMTLRLAIALGVGDEDLLHIRRGALLHDVGKIGVSDAILLKPGPLSSQEREVMKCHPDFAHHLLSPIEFLQPALDIPCSHHEKWDGTGYPRGLKGEEIPLAARIFAIVDVWDALRSDRPYRKGWPEEKVIAYLREEAGKHFDPTLLSAFLDLLKAEGPGLGIPNEIETLPLHCPS